MIFLKCVLLADLIAAVSLILIVFNEMEDLVGVGSALLIGLIFSPLILLLGFLRYNQVLKASRRQKQWLNQGSLHVLFVPKDGYTWGMGIVTETKECVVKNISSISVTSRYIKISGEIDVTETFNGMLSEKRVTKLKVPRNFDHEEMILECGGLSPTHH